MEAQHIQIDQPAPALPAATLPDPRHLDNLSEAQYIAMLESCIPTMKADHAAAVYMLAFLKNSGDVRVKRAQFMRSASRIQGGIPPFVEVALTLVKETGRKA